MSCEKCICRDCANDVNSMRGRPEEQAFPCFNCDSCRAFSRTNTRYNMRSACAQHKITKHAAEARRKQFTIFRGGSK